jgi:pimeloyl-ACP methyl ester carboxylesterase
METRTADGVTLRFDEAGEGDPAIVFVHGWCCSRGNWRRQVAHFSRSHRVIALDQRGHGESDKPDQDYTVGGFVDDLAWFIGDRGLDRPVIVGHSMGGVIAMNLARKHPDIARGIVMVDAPSTPLPEPLQPVAQSTLAAMRGDAYKQVAEGFIRTFMFDTNSPPDLVEELISAMSEAPQRLMHTALTDTLSPHTMEPGPIPVPALYIRAATNYAAKGEQAERYPGLEVTTIGCAHFIQLERPDETNALIEGLVARVARGAPA